MTLDYKNYALFLDIDGTLLDIAETPHSVIVPPSLSGILDRLSRKMGGALALISGRNIVSIDALFHPLKFPAAGSLGAEWRMSSNATVEEGSRLPTLFVQRVKTAFENIQGIVVEDKKFSLAVHYRQAPHTRQSLYDKLVQLAAPFQPELDVVEGKMVFEIACCGQDKARILKRFLEYAPFSGRRPVFIGDDAVDASAIEYCRRKGGVGIWVGKQSDGDCMADPQSVRNWLEENAG